MRYVRVSLDGLDEEGLDISGLVENDSLHVLLEHLLDGVPLRVRADVRNDLVLVLHLRFLLIELDNSQFLDAHNSFKWVLAILLTTSN